MKPKDINSEKYFAWYNPKGEIILKSISNKRNSAIGYLCSTDEDRIELEKKGYTLKPVLLSIIVL